jgi:hypothetical protein
MPAIPFGDRQADRRLLNRDVSVARIAAREGLTANGRSRPKMVPQRLEKIDSAPGNGMGSEVSNPQDLVHGRATDRARLRLTNRRNGKVTKLQKKVPYALKSLDAELKSAPADAAPAVLLRYAPRNDGDGRAARAIGANTATTFS